MRRSIKLLAELGEIWHVAHSNRIGVLSNYLLHAVIRHSDREVRAAVDRWSSSQDGRHARSYVNATIGRGWDSTDHAAGANRRFCGNIANGRVAKEDAGVVFEKGASPARH